MSHNQLVSQPDHGEAIGFMDGKPIVASERFQIFMDNIVQKLNDKLLGDQIVLESYLKASLPTVPANGIIHVSDETGGATLAYSNGTNWLRASDGAVVS